MAIEVCAEFKKYLVTARARKKETGGRGIHALVGICVAVVTSALNIFNILMETMEGVYEFTLFGEFRKKKIPDIFNFKQIRMV